MGCLHLTYPCTHTHTHTNTNRGRCVIKLSSWPIVGNLAFFFASTPFFFFVVRSLFIPCLRVVIVLSLCNMQDSKFFSIWLRQKRLINLIACHLSAIDGVCVCVCVSALCSLRSTETRAKIQREILLSDWLTSMPRLDDEHQTMWLAFGSTKTEIDFLSLSLPASCPLSFFHACFGSFFLYLSFVWDTDVFPSIFLFHRLIFRARDRIVSPNMGVQISGIKIYYAWLRLFSCWALAQHSTKYFPGFLYKKCVHVVGVGVQVCSYASFLPLLVCIPFSIHFNL